MDEWQYRPAGDQGLKPHESFRSLKREAGLIATMTQSAWRVAVRAYLRGYHRLRVEGVEHLPAKPPFVMIAMKCLPGKSWKFSWVRYEESRETAPIVSSLSPVAGKFDRVPLKLAIEGLHAEASGTPAASAVHHWSELIHHYVLRFAQPLHPDDRLWRLWQQVDADLAQPWKLASLAEIACVSEEHLRRLCRKELGRSPMQHLTFLRLQRARHLLAVTDEKVETIAKSVGFRNTFSFSNTFRSWIGVRPSEYRRTS